MSLSQLKMALLIGGLFSRRASCSDFRCHRVQGFCIYLLTILANIVHTESNNVTTSMQLEYTTIFIPNSTMEILVSFTSIPTPSSSSSSSSSLLSLSSLVGSSFDLAPSTALYPSPSPSGISQMWTSDITVYTAFESASEMTSELMPTFITPSMISSLTSPLSSTSLSSQSSVMLEASKTLRATSSVVSTEEMLVTSFELGNSSPTMSQNLSPFTSSMESSSPPPSSLGTSFIMSTPTVLMPSSVSMPTTSKSPSLSSSSSSSSSSPSSSSSSLFSSSFPLSYKASQSSISLINESSSSGATFTTTQSLSPTPIIPTPSPTMDTSTQPPLTTAGPDQLSILEWFGIAVGGAAVLFILFLLFHCYQLRQRTLRKQKKEMKKEILDFSQSNRNDRISSWRNSLALDAMAMHIELPQEDSMDMQALDNLGFEEVFLGDGPKPSSNNNYFLPQTNL